MPFTLQSTALLDPVTLGINCWLVPSRTVAEVGEMAIVVEELLLLLHPASERPISSTAQSHPNRTFMLLSPMSRTFLARPGREGSSFRMSG
jgi:hypothetical protein